MITPCMTLNFSNSSSLTTDSSGCSNLSYTINKIQSLMASVYGPYIFSRSETSWLEKEQKQRTKQKDPN